MEKSFYYAQNELIGLAPFKTVALEKAGTERAFAVAKQKVELTPLEVVFGTNTMRRGDIAYVSGDLCVTPAAKQVYEIDGQKVIFLKTTDVKLIKRVVDWSDACGKEAGCCKPAQPEAPREVASSGG